MSGVSRNELFDLTGKVAVVTGGGRGIGRGIAEGLAAFGARTILVGRTEATLVAARDEMASRGLNVGYQIADVGKEADILSLRDAVLAQDGRIDVLVNNAGINPIYRSIERTSLAEWQNILDTNLTGVFLCCKYLGPARIGKFTVA